VLDEPSVVALNATSGEILAVGHEGLAREAGGPLDVVG
jgi:actin-like ATPase involved in cell morphogenesis